jgi:lipopolysaccharide/colanic/teichoic acid biosynthesis glycosyltransferase
MVWNFIKGNMKIVGVRPLSRHYFSLYSEELQELRTKVKPGLIPPFYVDNPVTLEEIMESEKKYLNAYLKKPLRTDIKYFWKAFYNIVFKKARSN